MRLILVCFIWFIGFAWSSVLVMLPVVKVGILELALKNVKMNNKLYFSVDILTCNEEYDALLFEDSNIAVGSLYFSRLMCNDGINELTNVTNSSYLLESFRFDVIRAAVNIHNDIDVVLEAISKSSLVIFDSQIVNDVFMDVLNVMLGPSLQKIDVTHELLSIPSSIRAWQYVARPSYLTTDSTVEKTLIPEATELLLSTASTANNLWRAGQYPDRDCNCGRYRYKDIPPCYDLNGDAAMNLERFKVHPLNDSVQITLDGSSAVTPNKKNKKKLLLCMVYTISTRHDNLKAIVDTWGKRCDGFIAWSNSSAAELSALHIHVNRLNGQESYSDMWYKVISIWEMVALSPLIDEYEYFYLCGDDVYVIVNNLRQYLTSDFMVRRSGGGQVPVYLGRKVPHNHYLSYATGESGYVLNAKAVSLLVRNLKSRSCFHDVRISMEDIMVANCLLSSVGVRVMDTRDNGGNERFQVSNVTMLFHEGYLVNRLEGQLKNMKVGIAGFSEYSIAFHLMTPNDYLYCVDGFFQSIVP